MLVTLKSNSGFCQVVSLVSGSSDSRLLNRVRIAQALRERVVRDYSSSCSSSVPYLLVIKVKCVCAAMAVLHYRRPPALPSRLGT